MQQLLPQSDTELNAKLLASAEKINLRVKIGNTVSTDDYYEAQARRDGAFCDFSEVMILLVQNHNY